jgi:transposase
MKKIQETVGIDLSKSTLDACIHSTQDVAKFKNTIKGFKELLKWRNKHSPYSESETLFAMEHTGRYSHNIASYFSEHEIEFVLVPGLEIKRSLGITRGKDDQSDSVKIALYAYRLRDELKPTKIPDQQLLMLKRLLSLRNRMVRQRAGYKASLKEDKSVFSKAENSRFFKYQEDTIKALSKQISKIEEEMMDIINGATELKKIYKLLCSINGVGPQTALYMIVYTQGFTKFKNARKFASYCGIAPFPNKSGTSIRGRTKVSNLANKKIKSLLQLCAKSAIQYNPEMKAYYERRLEQEKNKMSTLNIIRNKLLARMFAVVKRGTPYVNTMKYVA